MSRALGASRAAFCCAALGLWACQTAGSPAGDVGAGTTEKPVVAAAPAAVPIPAPPAATAPASANAPPLGCRVMSSSGSIQRSSGEPLRTGDRFSGAEWLELGEASAVHLKHGASGREWTLEGPARALPCVDGQEELILAVGKLRTELGVGVRPGAQVLIGTPFGSVHYADANSELSVTRSELRLSVNAGEAWLGPAGSATGPETRVTRARPARRDGRARLLDAGAVHSCEIAARDSEARAQALLETGAPGLGKRAAEHVRARERARSSCASAAAVVLQQSSGEQLVSRLGELAGYREVWQRIPRAGG